MTLEAAQRLVLPEGLRGLNTFATAGWWSARREELAQAGISVETGVDVAGGRSATLLTWPAVTPGLPVLPVVPEGPRVLLVADPLRPRLSAVPAAEREAELRAWEADVAGWVDAVEGVTVELAARTAEPGSVAELAAAAAGIRWPLLELRRAVVEAAPAPSYVLPVAQQFADLVRDRIGEGMRAAWITQDLGHRDAAESFALAVVGDAGELGGGDLSEHLALRAAARAALHRLEAAGVHVTGPRDALLWPVPVTDGEVPVEVAVDTAMAVLRGVLERADPVNAGVVPGLEELDQLELALLERRRELKSLRRDPDNLRHLSGRRLLRVLVRGGRG